MSREEYVGVALNPGGVQKGVATGPTVFPPVTSEGIEADIATLEHNATIGTRAPERQKRGGRSFAGPLEGGARPLSFGVLLTMALGEPVSSVQPDVTNAPTVWRHTWNPLAANRRPMPGSLWTVNIDEEAEEASPGSGLIVDEYRAVVLDELAFNCESDNYLLFTAAMLALINIEGGVAPVATRDATELWSFDEVAAEISVPSINAGAYSDFAIYNFSFTYANQHTGADRRRLGTKVAHRLRKGNIEPTVAFEVAEDLESHYRRALADYPELVKVKLNAVGRELYDGGGTPASALYESLSLDLKAIEYTGPGGVGISAEDPLEGVPVEGRAVIDSGGALMNIVLTNEHDGDFYRAPVV